MTAAILSISFALLLPAEAPARTEAPRQANPFAPSLPLLTDKEEEELDQVIDRFILFDTGRLRGEEGKKALEDFQRLRPEAIPALIRGLNRAANIEASCPAVLIAKKLGALLNGSDDLALLEFARENIGVGVTQSRHMGVIKDLRVAILFRKRTVAQKGTLVARNAVGPKTPQSMTVAELSRAAGTEKGTRLQQILTELSRRSGDQVVLALGTVAARYDSETQPLARDLLDQNLTRQTSPVLKKQLKDDLPEVRAAAARVVAGKGLHFEGELIDLLTDAQADVRQAAHEALVRLSKGADFGPSRFADEAERARAVRDWRAWWAGKNGK